MVLVVSFLFYTNWNINQKRAQLTARIEALKGEIQVLEQKNIEFKERVSEVGSEEYLEKVAREQLNLKAPGEEVVVVKKEPASAEGSGEAKEEKKSWWEWLKNIWER